MQLKRGVTAAWRLLGSRRLSFWILGFGFALLLVWVVPFEITGQPQATVEAIGSTWPPMRIFYLAALLSTLACSLPRFKRDFNRARSWHAASAGALEGSPVVNQTLEAAEHRLVSAGYRTRRDGDTLRAVRHPGAPLGSSVAHLALLVLAVGLLTHTLTGTSTSVRVTEGQVLADGAREGTALPADVRRRMGQMRLDRITPRFYKDVLLFERLEASIEDSGRARVFSLAQPLWIDPLTHLSIQDFGLAPRFKIKQGGRTVQDSTIAMSIFPAGTEDSVDFERLGWSVSVLAYPDYANRGGRDVSLSYNVRNPRLLVTIVNSAGKVAARGLLAPGESLTAEGATLTLDGVSRYGSLRVSRSWGLPLMITAFFGLAGGLTWRLLFRRHDVVVRRVEEGVVYDAWLDMQGREAGRRAFAHLMKVDA